MSPAHPSAGYLLDTNVLSELMRPAPAQEVLRWFGGAVTSQLHTSAIHQAEILAAIALAARLGLVTRNTRDFESIEGLEVVNPWQPN